MTLDELEAAEQEAVASNDVDRLEELLKTYFVVKPSAELPFAFDVRFKNLTSAADALEGDWAVNRFNSISRNRRRAAYNLKLLFGYDGLKIVAEGDSWFEYPVLLKDVIDHLSDTYAVYSLAGGGHLLSVMANEAEYLTYIRQEKPDFFLLSGGGNDLLQDENLGNYLKPYQANMTAKQVLDAAKLEPFLNGMLDVAKGILAKVNAEFPSLVMLMHGYDYALPRPNGAWLGKPLEAKGVPKPLWNDVVRELIDMFNARLMTFEALFPGRFYHVDCRGTVGSTLSLWYDELHPKDAGYGRAAAKFIERIKASSHTVGPGADFGNAEMVSTPGTSTVEATGTKQSVLRAAIDRVRAETTGSPGLPENAARRMRTRAIIDRSAAFADLPSNEAITNLPPSRPRPKPPVVETPELKAWRDELEADPENRRSYEQYHALLKGQERETDVVLTDAVRRRLELSSRSDQFTAERIIGASNLYQVNYLSRGEKAAKAVGRIGVVTRAGVRRGYGTGFLVAPGLLLTNHHVLSEQSLVVNSHVMFEYEYDADHKLKPTAIFRLTAELLYTSAELDFTIVSVAATSEDGRSIAEFGFLPLIEESGKALDGEFVSIIQHPGGLPKQIALRDSQVIGRVEQYIYYSTDTNPGSSGAPVLNDDWLVTALHHRAVPDFDKPDSYLANRGIRISSLMEQLARAAKTDPQARAIHNLIKGTTTESPKASA